MTMETNYLAFFKLTINLKELNRNQEKRFCIQKMEGDIPQLNLANSFFVEGVKIGWPFPTIMIWKMCKKLEIRRSHKMFW